MTLSSFGLNRMAICLSVTSTFVFNEVIKITAADNMKGTVDITQDLVVKIYFIASGVKE